MKKIRTAPGRHLGVVPALALAAAMAGGAYGAAKSKLSASDTAAFASFRLSLEGVRKVAAANRDFRRIEKMSPGLKEKLETPEGEGPQSLDDSVRRIEGVPQAVHVLKRNHITARDYLLTTITLFGATMMASVEKETGQPASLPDSLARENVNFVKMNEEELAKLGPEIFQTTEGKTEKAPGGK